MAWSARPIWSIPPVASMRLVRPVDGHRITRKVPAARAVPAVRAVMVRTVPRRRLPRVARALSVRTLAD